MTRFLLFLVILVVPLSPDRTLKDSVQDHPGLQIIFLNVGQGDAALIQTPEGRVVLIDAGPGPEIVTQLRDHGVDAIDLVIASHPHSDHIGGMTDVFSAFPVRYYLDNGVPHTTATYQDLLQELSASDVTYFEATSRLIHLGSAEIQIVPPPGGDPSDQNNSSVGVLVRYGRFSAFFPGDAEVRELQYFLSAGIPDVTVLKVPHHGSGGSILTSFISAVSPEVAVISSGAGNSFGHPSQMTLMAYEQSGAKVIRTDVDGEVRIQGTEDGGFSVWTERQGEVILGSSPEVPSGVPPPALQDSRRPDELVPGFPSGVGSGISIGVHADADGNDHQNLNGEYVVISNPGTAGIQIEGWTLCDAANHCFSFPSGGFLPASGTIWIYTGSGTSDGVTFFMNSGRAVWNNDGDTAILYDGEGQVVVTYVY